MRDDRDLLWWQRYARDHIRFKRSPMWAATLEYWERRCAICGRESDEKRMIVPGQWQPANPATTQGTTTLRHNAVPLCHSRKGDSGGCNNLKRNKEPEAWLLEVLGEAQAHAKLEEIRCFLDWLEARFPG